MTSLSKVIKDSEKLYQEGVGLRNQGRNIQAAEKFIQVERYYELVGMDTEFTAEDYVTLRDGIMKNGLLSGMLQFGRWNSEHVYRNRRFLIEIMEKTNAPRELYEKLGDMILSQHAGRKITTIDCELAIHAYRAARNGEKAAQVRRYAQEKNIELNNGNGVANEYKDLNEYEKTPGIDALVKAVKEKITRNGIVLRNSLIALNFQRGCALEPLSNKEGCTTRYKDLSTYQKLDQFVLGGVNIGFVLLNYLGHTLREGQPGLIYDAAYDMQALSKDNRRGGRLNQGIIEFGFPLVTAMALYDPELKESADYIFLKAKDVLKNTTREDVQKLRELKQLAYILSRVERDVLDHDVDNVFDYYKKELDDANKCKNLNSIVHNRQFVEKFRDIQLVYEQIQQGGGSLADRVEQAYLNVFDQEDYKALGKGLVADFVAVALFMLFSYHKDEELVY